MQMKNDLAEEGAENRWKYFLQTDIKKGGHKKWTNTNEDKLILGGHEFTSRFILGSGKFSLDLVKACIEKGRCADHNSCPAPCK